MSRHYGAAHNRKLSLEDADEIRRLVSRGLSQRAVAGQFGVSNVMVNGIVAGKYYLTPDTPSQIARRKQEEAPTEASEAIALYRTEKAKREERLQQDARMLAAKADYAAQLERDRDAKKGGRPKKPLNTLTSTRGKPQIHATRSTDLADLLPAYHGAPKRGVA